MAFVERYVNVDAIATGGFDGTAETDEGGGVGPWSIAEWSAHTEGADRRGNIKEGAYTLGATTIQQAGTIVVLSVLRGYKDAIGDLEGQGRNADGTLNTTNFPAITMTGMLTVADFCFFEAINFTASATNITLGFNSADKVTIKQCAVLNSKSDSNTRSVLLNDNCTLINSDFECTGAVYSSVVALDSASYVQGCRFKGVGTSLLMTIRDGCVGENVFIGTGSNKGLSVIASSAGRLSAIANNTFYNLATAIEIPDAVQPSPLIIINNHATDNDEWLNNLYSGTANLAVIELHNRTRDNITPRTGIGDGVNISEIVTDTGDKDTDYEDADNGDFHLIATAPGVEAALDANAEIGAYQNAAGAGGGGIGAILSGGILQG